MVDYARLDHYWVKHHNRYKTYISKNGLICQECGGAGGETEPVLDDGSGPFYPCGLCEGTGLVTRWMRGQWLRCKKQEKKKYGRT